MNRTLLVEDDRELSSIIQLFLTHSQYEVDAAFTCAEALSFLETIQYDLILLDMVLPDKTGDELCKSICAVCTTPIIFISCLDDSDTIIRALRSGGDDYMVKPLCFDELLARADAIIRRAKPPVLGDRRSFRQFTVDTVHHRVLRGDEELLLSTIEYDLLDYMSRHADTLLLYQQIYKAVWNSDSLGDVRTLLVHISSLRKKIDPDKTGIIQTVRGAGYIFTDV
ncbi:MAG: response regulator transcription factor [Oscillospiraceae bacterium]